MTLGIWFLFCYFKDQFWLSSEKCYVVCIYPSSLSWAWCDTKSIFKWRLTGLNSILLSYTGSHTNVKVLSLPYYLPITEGRIVRCLPFSRVVSLYEMQTALCRIWTWVTLSIFYDDNSYTYRCCYINMHFFVLANVLKMSKSSICTILIMLVTEVWFLHEWENKSLLVHINIQFWNMKESGYFTKQDTRSLDQLKATLNK